MPVQELIHQQESAGGGGIVQGIPLPVLAVFLPLFNPYTKGQTVCGWVHLSYIFSSNETKKLFNY